MVGTGNAGQNNFLKIHGLNSGMYKWSVQCIDNCFEGSSFAQEFTLNYTGIKNNDSKIPRFSVYPNPFNYLIKVESPGNEKSICDILIKDMSGKTLINLKNIALPYKINTSLLTSGVYILSILQDNSVSTMKIVKK